MVSTQLCVRHLLERHDKGAFARPFRLGRVRSSRRQEAQAEKSPIQGRNVVTIGH